MTGGRGPASAATPIGRGVVRLGLVLLVAFAILAGGAGYWQVVRSADLVGRPDDPLLIAAARNVVRGEIRDRDGHVLATSKRDKNREPYRVYPSMAVAPVIGYASRQFGTAGLERAYDAQLSGIRAADPVDELLSKFATDRYRPQDLTLSLSLDLQKEAVRLLGKDRGAVVMLDPRNGEVLALASTPTYDAGAIASPDADTAKAAFATVVADRDKPLLDRAIQGRYVPGSVFKIVTSIAALGSGAITPDTRFTRQPQAEKNGLLVSGFRIRDGHHPFTGSRALDYPEAVEVSCNIYFALAGLATGGENLADWAAKLGFGGPIPFDLPTASSQVTNGGGTFGGGFADDVELANAAYGQAETLATPLQMALVAATVADRGTLMKPRLVTRLSNKDGATDVGPAVWREVMSPEIAAEINAAMVRAVEGDEGRLFTPGAKVPGVLTAGKTGTAQLDGSARPHSWFIGFAPADDPQVAIAVLVESGGSGASRASPIAGRLMARYLDTVAK
ncbi:MAG: penicillin-binding protein [Chloroflexota bacterium]|nr:penicillin-binding protein [Chloroflexota bacterium]